MVGSTVQRAGDRRPSIWICRRTRENHALPALEDQLDAKKVTPMVAQYQAIKEQYPDVILMFRHGRFLRDVRRRRRHGFARA